jgi:glycosyltransferase involved in cell wall biosynthesis
MRAYVDARCLQEPHFAERGIGFHAVGLMRQAKRFFGSRLEIVGLIDDRLGPLPNRIRQLIDRCQGHFEGVGGDERGLFIQLSPSTHDQAPIAHLLACPQILSAAVVYDFIPLEEPARYLRTSAQRRAYLTSLVWLKQYDHYFPISHWTAGRLREILGVNRSAVSVTGAGVRSTLSHAGLVPIECGREYFLAVGGSDPRKNVEAAVKALALLVVRMRQRVHLVLVGDYGPAHCARLQAIFHKLGGKPGLLEFRQGVSDPELSALYQGAIATVCPSRMEGFSLPIAEAVSCGSSVIAANCPAQEELLADEESLFAPDDHERLSHLMERLLCEPERRGQLYERHRWMASHFAEAKVAERFWQPLLDGFFSLSARRAG